jgi:hypothetical protein
MLPVRTKKSLVEMALVGILRDAGGTFRFPHGAVRDHSASNAPNMSGRLALR